MKKIFLISGIFAIAAMLVFSGCVEKVEKEAKFDLNKTIETQKSVKSYAFSGNMLIYPVKIDEAMLILVNSIPTSGKVDIENKSGCAEIRIKDYSMKIEYVIKIYVIGDVMYMEIPPMYGENGGWIKFLRENMDEDEEWSFEDVWMNLAKQYENTIEVLKGAEVKVIDEENIDGVDCYKIDVKPNKKIIAELYKNRLITKHGLNEESIKEIKVTYFVAKDTNYVIRSIVEIVAEAEYEETKTSANVKEDIKYSGINKPMHIILPEEAKNAKTIEETNRGSTNQQ